MSQRAARRAGWAAGGRDGPGEHEEVADRVCDGEFVGLDDDEGEHERGERGEKYPGCEAEAEADEAGRCIWRQ